VSIGNLSSAPDQAGFRSEHDALMELHLSLPDGLAHAVGDPFAATPSVVETALVQQEDGGDEDDESGGSAILNFLPLVLIVVAVYFLLLRPRQRQMKQQRELQSNLEVGDEVMLTSGLYGFITAFESDIVWVEIDDDVQIRVTRAAVSGKVDTAGAAAATAASAEATEPTAESTSEPTTGAPRRPTLKGGSGTKPSTGPAPESAPAPATGESTTDESTDE
jgi:preprotein translocase subunit YajC